MHTTVGIITETQATDEATVTAARTMLVKFDYNLSVPPYRDYPDKSYVDQLLKNHKVRSLEELAIQGFDGDGGEDGGIDEKGLFFISTQNPDGEYDAYSFFDGPVVVSADTFTKDRYVCGDIITPDGKLHSGPITYRDNPSTRKQKLAEWNQTLQGFAKTYTGKSLVLFDCHS